ncbi:hypothetical protein N7532_006961 [Penicillium argentinense]|uniref:Uncharacterized protein n=1 Tax=Penicillium argentinense TaxID=1131581 RepID=A0A9W9KBA8_9EURO|nr:uncharacterized protein N7532_006961 [Penicillium argentinense]KAJ5099960.1 hypothetical protein N7532_006961 [Penicillium argentinense]
MSTEPRSPDRSVLDESWVMASTVSLKDRNAEKKKEQDRQELATPTPPPRPRSAPSRDGDKLLSESSESLDSSSWSMSGPELIMPSIYEAPISEASWVAPDMRPAEAKRERDVPGMRKRRKVISEHLSEETKSNLAPENPDAGSSTPTKLQSKPQAILAHSPLNSLYRDQRALLRNAVNVLLGICILHLLLLPELIYQAQNLCHLPGINPHPSTPSHPITIKPEETIIASQTHLETIFTTSLETLTPLAHTLKESESMLRDLQSDLQHSFPDARNALTLEFQGSEKALRAASWEFDSLRADVRSAIDSLLASPPTQEPVGSSVARDTRLAAQLRRRAEYLDRLRAQIRSKTDSLSTRFSTLDDHLEAIDGIVSREERRSLMDAESGSGSSSGSTDGEGLQGVLDSLSSYASFGAKLLRGGSTGSDSRVGSTGTGTGSSASSASEAATLPRPSTTLALLRFAATHHLPVADSVVRLSRQLQDVQRARV